MVMPVELMVVPVVLFCLLAGISAVAGAGVVSAADGEGVVAPPQPDNTPVISAALSAVNSFIIIVFSIVKLYM
jgi:hypothetical protein